VSAGDLIAATRDDCAALVARLEAARAQRVASAATLRAQAAASAQLAAAIKQHERTAYVGLADAIRAGNCRTATITWAAQHGFPDPRKHYPVRAVRAVAAGMHRVDITIQQALSRHASEMLAGVCSLDDHVSAA
jgi:hypothetical protein